MARQSLADRKAALEAELSQISEKLAAENAEKITIIGEAITAEMKADQSFKTTVEIILARRVKAKKKRDLLGLPPASPATASQSEATSNDS